MQLSFYYQNIKNFTEINFNVFILGIYYWNSFTSLMIIGNNKYNFLSYLISLVFIIIFVEKSVINILLIITTYLMLLILIFCYKDLKNSLFSEFQTSTQNLENFLTIILEAKTGEIVALMKKSQKFIFYFFLKK